MSSGQLAVEGIWHGGLRCDVKMGDFDIIVDEPESVGGSNLGPQPTELFLASIASCFTLAIAYSAQKRSIEVHDLSVTVTGTYDGPGFRAIAINARLNCDTEDVASLMRAAERVCYVTNTLKSENVEIDLSFTEA